MTGKLLILIVDDEKDICEQISGMLEDNFYDTIYSFTSDDALKKIKKYSPKLIILDIWLNNSKLDGFTLLKKIKNFNDNIPVIMISGHGNIETAINSIKNGAFDFIEKPFDSELLLFKVKKALENQNLKNKIEQLIDNEGGFSFIHKSVVTARLRELIEKISKTESFVLLKGPPGSGKEIVAKFIHRQSNRSKSLFRVINCANLDPKTFEKKLFGMEKSNGEITKGILEECNGGTILLDQIEDMPVNTQGRIIGFLEEQKFTRVGGMKNLITDIRIISSTRSNLEKCIKLNQFREDLYFKLNVIPINVPPLEDRKEDIESLVSIFSNDFIKKNNFKEKKFSKESISFFKNIRLNGNVRQLKNLVEWILILLSEKNNYVINISDIPNEVRSQFNEELVLDNFGDISMKEARENFEKKFLEKSLKKYNFNINRVSNVIKMERTALYRKLKSLKIKIPKK